MYKSIYADFESYNSTIQFAMDIVKEYETSGHYFDPFKILTDTMDRKTRLAVESMNFINDLENLILEYRDARKKCL